MRRASLAALLCSFACAAAASPATAAPQLQFSKPIFVDPGLAGGEPLVFADLMHGTIIYTSHEGTTHLYRDGLATTAPAFYTGYRNQVNNWYSTDLGSTWTFANFLGSGFGQNPAQNTGFSDPDLTQDDSGRIYNTGIDLANDALFSTGDGGKTWDRGTPQCHDGDRPWLAGGKKDEVWMGTNAAVGGHVIITSTDGGNTCSTTTLPHSGGEGKLYFVDSKQMLVEPTANGTVDRWKRGDAAFTPGAVVIKGGKQSHWAALALDKADTLYIVWDTNPSGPNQVQWAYSKDFGASWSKPITIAAPPKARVLWPWIAAGDAGKINIVWYQSDKVVDFDSTASQISIYSATVLNASDPAKRITTEIVDVAGRPIHNGGVCQGGTTCVATGQDRRLGDFFTNDVMANGCVMVASGDTTRKDPITGRELPTSLPIFMRQTSGPSLYGNTDCSGQVYTEPAVQPPPAISGSGLPVSSSGCRDKVAPVSRFNRKRAVITRRRIILSGTSSDLGCGPNARAARLAGRVARVTVAIGRAVKGRKCRFLKANGKYGKAVSCLRTKYLRARGTTRWYFNFAGRFPKGQYKVWVRGIDTSRNTERKNRRRNLIILKVR